MIFVLFSLLLSINSLAQTNAIIVTASKSEQTLEKSSASIQIITKQEIEQSNALNLVELISSKTSIFISDNGPYGGVSDLKLRGFGRGFVKFVIDEIEVYDTTDISNGHSFQHLDLNHVQSIEIIRGPQALLYGSDAAGGVIKINTLNDKKSRLNIFYGSDHTITSAVSTGQKNLSIAGSLVNSRGISKIQGQGNEQDKYAKTQFNTSVSKKILGGKLTASYLALNTNQEIDNFNSDLVLNDQNRSKQQSSSIEFKKTHGDFLNHFIFSQNEIEKFDETGFENKNFKGKSQKFDWRTTFAPNDFSTTLWSVQFLKDSDDVSEKNIKSYAFYIAEILEFNRIIFSIGSRFQKWESLDDSLTPQVGLKAKLTDKFSFKANYSGIFKTPSLYQLYSTYGNQDLENIKGHGVDFGLLLKNTNFNTELTFFYNKLENSIDFINNQYQNIGESQTQGIELELKKRIKNWTLGIHSSFTEAKDLQKNTTLSRVPKFKSTQFLIFNFSPLTSLEVSSNFTGTRKDSPGVEMPSYLLFDINFMHDYFRLKVHNLLNKEYQNIKNYEQRGLSIYAGLAFSI
jgi:vitamin B12 transporter